MIATLASAPAVAFTEAVRNSPYTGDERLIEKWTARATIINFRLRPWLPTARVRAAQLQLESDIAQSLVEIRGG